MARSKTTLKAGHNLPPRGRSLKTRLLEVIREESMIGLSKDATKDEAEKRYIKHIAMRAFDTEQDNSSQLLLALFNKSYSNLKQVAPDIEIKDFPSDGTPAEKARHVMDAIAKGEIPADVGGMIISAAKDCIIIEEGTELKGRIADIEKKLGIDA